jgi:hypothetical protein
MKPTVFLFSEAEKGDFGKPLICHSLIQLYDTFGAPKEDCQGIHYAIQSLLYNREILFCRVKEEGFSSQDYMRGLSTLRKKSWTPQLQAIFIPGVGDQEIIEATTNICKMYNSLLILTEKDLYDYLMCMPI